MSIDVKNLNYIINGHQILYNINLKILPGKILTIIGPNGSGKSTFIKMIAGDTKPNSGSIFYNQLQLEKLSLEEKAKTRAVMSQSQLISFDFSVREIVEMGWISKGIKNINSNFDNMIKNISEKCYIHDLLSRNFNTLSGGEKKRVHFARTLLQLWTPFSEIKNQYLILDEPLNDLDLFHILNTIKIIRNMANKNIGIVMIIHDLNLAAKYSDNIAIFKNGKLKYYGSPEEVIRPNILSKIYGFKMQVNKNPLRVDFY